MLLIEADRCKNLNDLLFACEDTLIGQDELKNRVMLLGAVDVMLDIEGADLVGQREALDLAVGNGAHEGRLSGTVLAAQTVAVAMLQVESSSVEQDLGTISERELAVAKIFSSSFSRTSWSLASSEAEQTTQS